MDFCCIIAVNDLRFVSNFMIIFIILIQAIIFFAALIEFPSLRLRQEFQFKVKNSLLLSKLQINFLFFYILYLIELSTFNVCNLQLF